MMSEIESAFLERDQMQSTVLREEYLQVILLYLCCLIIYLFILLVFLVIMYLAALIYAVYFL